MSGYIAPVIIDGGNILVNHILSIDTCGVVSDISPFETEVANTAYLNGIIIVADKRMLTVMDDLKGVVAGSFNRGLIECASAVVEFIQVRGISDFSYRDGSEVTLHYIDMDNGIVSPLS